MIKFIFYDNVISIVQVFESFNVSLNFQQFFSDE